MQTKIFVGATRRRLGPHGYYAIENSDLVRDTHDLHAAL